MPGYADTGTSAVKVVVPASVQEPLMQWLLGQGLELYPVPSQDDWELPVFKIAVRIRDAA